MTKKTPQNYQNDRNLYMPFNNNSVGKWTLRQKSQGHLTRQRKTLVHDESHEGN